MSKLDGYKHTWYYKKLIEKYSLDEEGTWRVRGEDPNCDFGGYHHMPDLGYFQGKLADIVAMAVEHPGFWQWGAGGEITKIRSVAVTKDSIKEIQKLKDRKAELERELQEVNKVLEGR